jgi:hypothetical protein
MNYATLFETIKGYCENDFPNTSFTDVVGSGTATLTSTEQINTFIQQAEQRIFNTVQFPSIRKNVTGTITNGNKYLSSPSDFLAVYSMAVIDNTGAYEYLLNKDVNFIRESYPTPTDTGKPQYYALFGPTTTNDSPPNITNELTFILGPTPNAAYSVELHYYYYPESITVAASGTTWLGDNFDSVLLYGSLLEAYTFMKGEQDVIANYSQRYNEALAMARRLGDGMERSDAYRSGQARVAPLPQNNGVR